MTEDDGGWTTGTADSPQGPEHAAQQALRVRTWAPPSVATLRMVTLGLAAASWVLAIQLMREMDPHVALEIGSFAFLMTLGVTMMALGAVEVLPDDPAQGRFPINHVRGSTRTRRGRTRAAATQRANRTSGRRQILPIRPAAAHPVTMGAAVGGPPYGRSS